MTIQKWGGLAFFLLAVAFIVPSLIYLFGDLQTADGPFAYALADFLYGPVWAVSLVTGVLALREHIGEHAPRRMSLALLAAVLAAAAMVAVACIRSANRHYHIIHPELHLETSTTVLIVWTTIVAGVNGAGWHFLGWAQVLVGWAGWTSRRLPRLLSLLALVYGAVSLFVYALPSLEPDQGAVGVLISIWMGILLWKAKRGETQAPEKIASETDQA